MWFVGFFKEREYSVGSDITFNLAKLHSRQKMNVNGQKTRFRA